MKFPDSHSSSLQKNDSSEQPLLRLRDAARMLAISERTLWGLTNEGKVASVQIGRSVRYDPADLRKFIAAQRKPFA